MTAGQLARTARNVTIACARRGGLPYAILAEAWGLSERRVKAIVEDLAQGEALKDSLVGLLQALEQRREVTRRPSKKFTRRAASL